MESGAQSNRKRGRQLIKRLAVAALLIVVMAGIFMVARPKPLDVETAVVQRGELLVFVAEDGTSRVRDRYVISAPLSGNLARIGFHTGDAVTQGEVLAHILPVKAPLLDARTRSESEARVAAALAGVRQANAQIERAQANAEYASQEAKRAADLLERKVISNQENTRAQLEARSSQAELSSAQFSAKVARHQLAMAQAALGRLNEGGGETDQFEVTSPISGQVLKVFQQSEGVVQAGAPLLEVGDPQALEIAVDVLTSDAVQIRAGAPAILEHWGGAPLKATVRLIEPSAFTRVSSLGVEEQRVNAILELNSPYEQWKPMGDGYRVEARIETYRNPSAVKVPWSALFRRNDEWAVFLVKDGVARVAPVVVGKRSASHAEVMSGLSPGERVVVHPSDKLQDGAALSIDRSRSP